jgi:hypothetical protein
MTCTAAALQLPIPGTASLAVLLTLPMCEPAHAQTVQVSQLLLLE